MKLRGKKEELGTCRNCVWLSEIRRKSIIPLTLQRYICQHSSISTITQKFIYLICISQSFLNIWMSCISTLPCCIRTKIKKNLRLHDIFFFGSSTHIRFEKNNILAGFSWCARARGFNINFGNMFLNFLCEHFFLCLISLFLFSSLFSLLACHRKKNPLQRCWQRKM